MSGHSEDIERAAKLEAQWPKAHTHSRGGGFEFITEDGWRALPHHGYQEDPYGRYELRNCHCGSTLMCVIEIKDVGAE